MPQNEITTAVSVLTDAGGPQNFGWSRQPGFFYDPALVWAPRRKLFESDRYIAFSPTHLGIFEIRDGGYLGHMGVSIISLTDKQRSTQTIQTLFPLGSYEMPSGSLSGTIRRHYKKSNLEFFTMEKGARIVRVDISQFGQNRKLCGELVLNEPMTAESLVTNLPWRNEKSAFQYSRRSPWYAVEGVLQFGTTDIVFPRGDAWGIFDWNRGVRPRADVRYWAAACGKSGDRQVSFSVGYGSADSSAGTENAFFVDGRLHKLDQVTFHIPPANWLAPWRFTSNDNRLVMEFTPHQERVDRQRVLFHSITRHQVCGFFSGKVILDDGAVLEFEHITGFAERSRTKF